MTKRTDGGDSGCGTGEKCADRALPGPSRRAGALAIATRAAVLLIVVVTMLTFAQVLKNDFVSWDDDYTLIDNDAYRGLSGKHLWWMFTTSFTGHYQPLSWLSFAIDAQIWRGVSPAGFHLTNLLLHVLTSVGFFFVARRLIAAAIPGGDLMETSGARIPSRTHAQRESLPASEEGPRRDSRSSGRRDSRSSGRRDSRSRPCRSHMGGFPVLAGAVAATLMFAVHPLRVESVAWATERRDVLSGAWLMLTILFYLRAVGVEKRSASRRLVLLGVALVCYVLSVLSKASAISLPLVLLLLDVYPLRRFGRRWRPLPNGRVEVRHGSATSVFHRLKTGATPDRLATGATPDCLDTGTTGRAKGIIVEKALFAVPAVLIALVALWAQAHSGALRSIAEHPITLRIGQACYGIMFYLWKTVWPSGLIPLYEQDPHARALALGNVLSAGSVVLVSIGAWINRRRCPALLVAWATYLALLAPVLGLAQSGPQLVADRYSYLPCMPWAVLIGGGVTWVWTYEGKRRTRVRVGVALVTAGIIGLLTVLTAGQTRVWADSETLWKTVLARAPNTGTAHANLAVLLGEKADYTGARDHSLAALAILPGNRVAHIELGHSSAELGDLVTADKHLRVALSIRPNDVATMLRLASVTTRLGRHDQAEQLYRTLIELGPGAAVLHSSLAGFLASRGRFDESRTHLERALDIDPSDSDARFRLGIVLLTLDDPAAAIASFEKGLEYAPHDIALLSKLAWVLATCKDATLRDGPRAVELARSAVGRVADAGQAPPTARAASEALAAALAETGDFAGAIDTVNKLLADEPHASASAAYQRLNLQLESYQQGRPIRE